MRNSFVSKACDKETNVHVLKTCRKRLCKRMNCLLFHGYDTYRTVPATGASKSICLLEGLVFRPMRFTYRMSKFALYMI